ncbi:hypothetical protein [uncultured Roseovarius sp.]|uniref:hypothetical protein n=1 Tax=uncultured Roseovarius sp. TaxID=293344 RepID=UPI002601C29D|nr:hypothetical protein [uncultured Roseovarius sp.]
MTPNPNPSASVSFERNYPGVSPQLLAHTRQMWSARGLDLDRVWQDTIVRLRGFRNAEEWNIGADSRPIDNFFMFDQAIIWVAALHASAGHAVRTEQTGLSVQQWESLHALTFRMIEQLDAIRVLFLTDLPTPSMQIARSISEDVDMALAFVARPKLARRFVECATTDEATEFWRRHIAGGRAFKAVSEQLYRAGLEFDQSGEYAAWRRRVGAILGTAVHTSFRPVRTDGPGAASGQFSKTGDCLYFVTLRLQEMCAYSHGLRTEFGEDLAAVSKLDQSGAAGGLAKLTPLISEIAMAQMIWTLDVDDTEEVTV